MSVPTPEGVERVVPVESTQDLLDAVQAEAADADVLVMAAAVADFRPAEVSDAKMKKGDDGGAPVIVLERTPDVLATAVRTRSEGGPMAPLIVGFAAETGDATSSVLEYGRAKLARKGCEMLVVNEVGTDKVFGRDETAVTILFADGRPAVETVGSKDQAAAAVVQAIVDDLAGRDPAGASGR